jgi:SOS-response transcriptional repressor LexA
MSAFGKRLRELRARAGLTQVELARQAELNQGFVSEMERGLRNAGPKTIQALAEALGVPEAILVGEGDEHDAPQPLDTRELPLYGSIPGGPPSTTQESVEMIPVLRHLWADDHYCLKLSYDSMEPTLKPGDIILVHYRPDVNPEHVQGKICACLVCGEPTLKRVNVEQRGKSRRILLRGDNPRIKPTVIDRDADFSIQGVVIKLVSREL